MIDAEKLATQLGERGAIWANAQGAFRALEDTEKSVLAEYTQKYMSAGAKSQAAAESQARACTEFREFLAAKATARHEYGLATVKYETMKVFIEMQRSNQAYERTQMGLV
jgi:phosphoglycolate phosphatase-like HAD superfamily hydrolase|tara:strand:+ start:1426 stop:1755 length:330 start_codon:yes stop_codon:yes gene_type:complete